MSVGRAVLLNPSAQIPTSCKNAAKPFICHRSVKFARKSFTCHTSKIAVCKSFVCHTCDTPLGSSVCPSLLPHIRPRHSVSERSSLFFPILATGDSKSPSPFFRISFQVPYSPTPFFLHSSHTAGVWGCSYLPSDHTNSPAFPPSNCH